LQTVLITDGPGAQWIMQVSNMFTFNFIFCPSKANSRRFKSISCDRTDLNNALTYGKLQRCQTLRGDLQITAEANQAFATTNKDLPQHDLTAQRYLELLLNTQQVPFMKTSDWPQWLPCVSLSLTVYHFIRIKFPWSMHVTSLFFARELASFVLCCHVIGLFNRPQANHKHNIERNVVRMWAAVSFGGSFALHPKKRLRRRLVFMMLCTDCKHTVITYHWIVLVRFRLT